MGGEWRRCRLGEVVDINPDTIGPDWPFDYIRYVDISSVVEGSINEPQKWISLSEAPSRAKRLVKAGDTVLSTVRPGRRSMFFVRETIPDLVVSTGFAVLRPQTDRVDPRFLYACVFDKAFTAYLVSKEKGAAYPAVLPADIAEAEISIPPLPEQRAIAHILGTLDDKIELNRKMNQTLEAIARAIFKSWFVDFDPVIDNALAAGKPIPEEFAERAARRAQLAHGKSPLPENIRRLFPDEFQDSELGPIPKGWKVSVIGEEFNITMGQSPPGRTYNETGDGLPFFQGRRDFGFRYPTKRVYCSEPKRIAEAGDALVTVRAPVGEVNMAWERVCIGRGVAALRHRSGGRSFTYYAVSALQDQLKRYEAEGTVFGSITKRQLVGMKWLAPSQPVLERFELLVSPVDEQIRRNEGETGKLVRLRDALLSKLISGELRIPNGEELMGATV